MTDEVRDIMAAIERKEREEEAKLPRFHKSCERCGTDMLSADRQLWTHPAGKCVTSYDTVVYPTPTREAPNWAGRLNLKRDTGWSVEIETRCAHQGASVHIHSLEDAKSISDAIMDAAIAARLPERIEPRLPRPAERMSDAELDRLLR